MENRKRPRFEMITTTNSSNSNNIMQGVASTTTAMGTATIATIGGQSFILSSNSSSSLPANIFLSICDENSNDSEEYILDHSELTPVKHEHTVATQTTNNQNQLQQTLVNSGPQYRIVNQAGKPLNSTSLNTSSMINSSTNNSLHLPAGCEIYVVKEVFDLPNQVFAESTNNTTTGCKTLSKDTNITVKPSSPLPQPRHSTFNGNNTKIINSKPTITVNKTTPVTSTCNTSSTISTDETAKRGLTLEAYKKRDDKRRATHNEVERRRRDKINSLIFKLRQMLPSDTRNSNGSFSSSSSINHNNSTNRLSAQQGTASSTRTPPGDSKSQILIKACEYIKSMQEEISSLRECLTENENLRFKNQRLQDEINKLRRKQHQQQKLRNNNNNILLRTHSTTNNRNNINQDSDDSDKCEITLNSLNTTYANVQLFEPTSHQNNHHHHHLADIVGLTTNTNAATSTPLKTNYAKRELIITDYVD